MGLPSGRATFNVARVKSKPQQTEKSPDFEQSLTELEALVAKLEQGDVPLEEALKTFERGVALTRQCQTALRTAQQKVEVLLARNGEETIESLVDDDEADDEEDDVDDEDER
jgi:exodeoxyribonuclease VII small subunit